MRILRLASTIPNAIRNIFDLCIEKIMLCAPLKASIHREGVFVAKPFVFLAKLRKIYSVFQKEILYSTNIMLYTAEFSRTSQPDRGKG